MNQGLTAKTDKRELTQAVYMRVCRDSGFTLEATRAAHLAARILKCSPLDIWIAMGTLETMDRIANGTHPALTPVFIPPLYSGD